MSFGGNLEIEEFERHRPHLHAVAYRMLGSASESPVRRR